MPGKVNPVIPEMTMQCAMRIIANDTAITMAAAHGEFELNAFLPLIADSLLESLELAERAVTIFREKCVETIEPDVENCKKHLEQSYAFATAYTPKLGYENVAKIIKENPPEKAKEILMNSDFVPASTVSQQREPIPYICSLGARFGYEHMKRVFKPPRLKSQI